MSRHLAVLLHGHLIGHLAKGVGEGMEFRFSRNYAEISPRPVLGQKFEDDLGRAYLSRKGQGLPDFFANLIPEGRLREMIETAAGIEAGDDLALLAHVGEDLPGAIVVRPAVAEETEDQLSGGRAEQSGDSAEEMREEALRFSLAGVQLKFSMLRDDDKLTLPARHQGGDWIVKFASPTFQHLPENEYSIMTWAKMAGFDVPDCRLHSVSEVQGFPRKHAAADTRVLAIKRYDRADGERIHQEDFAQAVGLPPAKKYDQITYEAMARLARGFMGEMAVEELIRRLALVIASGNGDAHLKNWSLVYSDKIRATWSPVYDQVATVAWGRFGRRLALKLAGVKDMHRIDSTLVQRFAEKAEVPTQRALDLVGSTLHTLRDTWRQESAAWPMDKSHLRLLREHWEKVPLLREIGPLD